MQQLAEERRQQEAELSERQVALDTLQHQHSALQADHEKFLAENASLRETLDALRTGLAASLELARTEAAATRDTRVASLAKLTANVDKQRQKIDELTTLCAELEAENTILAEELAASQRIRQMDPHPSPSISVSLYSR